MTTTIEFFYDYASPFSWLADQRLPAMAAEHGARIVYRPVLLGATIMGAGNTPPPAVPAKATYYQTDMARWARRLGVPFRHNPDFPVNTLTCMRGALVAMDRREFDPYHRAMWAAMWQQQRNLAEADEMAAVIAAAGLDADAYLAATGEQAIKQRLKDNVDELIDRGGFGLPTFFVGTEMFFGNDRVDFVAEAVRD